jgi:substrate import-associated zinc metallohydrolase lipoprotein
MKRKYVFFLLTAILLVSVTSCENDDNLSQTSVFVDDPDPDPASITYAFDRWLDTTYLIPYNIDFRYKLKDVSTDMDFNLVPTQLEKSQQLAILIKYLWFDVYGKRVDSLFLQKYGPRILALIGSAATNPSIGTEILGLAEGGIKISLFKCNEIDVKNMELMNEYIFKTMHHEFAHVLHQQKTYPKEFENLSAGWYLPGDWQHRTDSEAASVGCASPYGSSQPREDFVEIIANYIVKSDAWWTNLYILAAEPGINESKEEVPDNIDGEDVLRKKVVICRDWLQESWGVNLDSIRAEVQERQLHIDEVLAQKYW